MSDIAIGAEREGLSRPRYVLGMAAVLLVFAHFFPQGEGKPFPWELWLTVGKDITRSGRDWSGMVGYLSALFVCAFVMAAPWMAGFLQKARLVLRLARGIMGAALGCVILLALMFMRMIPVAGISSILWIVLLWCALAIIRSEAIPAKWKWLWRLVVLGGVGALVLLTIPRERVSVESLAWLGGLWTLSSLNESKAMGWPVLYQLRCAAIIQTVVVFSESRGYVGLGRLEFFVMAVLALEVVGLMMIRMARGGVANDVVSEEAEH
jgi:hypothetical protein